MWIDYNPNPLARRVDDCAVRAVAKALNESWEQAYVRLFVNGLAMGDMARGRGSFARRDSMGRYSGGTSMASDIRRLMENAPDDQTRAELGRIAQRYE